MVVQLIFSIVCVVSKILHYFFSISTRAQTIYTLKSTKIHIKNTFKTCPYMFPSYFKTIIWGPVDSTLSSYQVEIRWYTFVIELCGLRPYVITVCNITVSIRDIEFDLYIEAPLLYKYCIVGGFIVECNLSIALRNQSFSEFGLYELFVCFGMNNSWGFSKHYRYVLCSV